nr:hypothetical protein [Micromonospora sp. DSM 115978]
MDAVYLVGEGRQRGEPLRYSLRSLINVPQVDRVVIVGYRPPWCRPDLHLPVQQGRVKHINTWTNLMTALESDGVSDEFLLFNDDFFVMSPVEQMPVLHRGPITGQIANHKRTGHRPLLHRRQNLRDMLNTLGVAHPLCYELHTPMPVVRAGMLEALQRAKTVRPDGMAPTGKRTLYGNLARLGGVAVPDVKVRMPRDPLPDGPLMSTSPAAWMGTAGRTVRTEFAQPSRFEKGRR